MTFNFEITRISRLDMAGLGVLEGNILDGSVTVGQIVELVHEAQCIPVRVKGVLLGARTRNAPVTLSINLDEPAMAAVTLGDRLVAA